LSRALAFLVLAGFASLPLALGAQDIPDALKDKALVVRVTAIVPAPETETGEQASPDQGEGGAKAQDWEAESSKDTVTGSPVHFKLVGANVAIIVQITPFEQDDGKTVTLIAQGQVWVKPPEGGLSYHTNVDTLTVTYGETVLFFPLGRSPEGKAPMRIEISVDRASDLDSSGTDDKSGK
jgi:hypothetical protein